MPIQVSKRRLYQAGSIVCLGAGLYNLIGGVIVTLQENKSDMTQHIRMILSGIVLVALGIYFSYKSTQPDHIYTLCGNT